MAARIVRLILSLILVILMWMDFKWALYVLVTLSLVAAEIFGFVIGKIKQETQS